MKTFLKTGVCALALSASGFAVKADEPNQSLAHEMLRDSIAMRTVEGYGQVSKFATYLAEKFEAAGFPEDDIHILPAGGTTALVVRYRGDGSSGRKPVMFSAHMDVVEAFPEDWVRDPYTLTEEDGYFFGRGVSDNKFGVAALSATFMRLKTEGYVPNRDLLIVFSGDEETKMLSTIDLATKYRSLIDAEFAMVADGGGGLLSEEGVPVSFTVDSAEKTYASFEITARNPGGHSSLPRKDNAISDLARALVKLDAFEFPVMASELTRSYFANSASLIGGEVGAAMTAFSADPTDTAALKVLRAQPEYVGSTGTTCVATMLKGGHAENALPQSATATVNCRIFPGVGVEATLKMLKSVVANDALEWKVLDDPVESDASPIRDDVFGVIADAVHAEFPGLPIIPHMASGASDALHFRAAGIPSYTFTGIFMKASDEYAHGLNERVPSATLPVALRMWYRIMKDVSR